MKIFRFLAFCLITALCQHSTAQAPVILSFSPQSAKPGSAVTINGTNFSALNNNNLVFFGSQSATVTAASSTQLTVTVPAAPLFAPITVVTSGGIAYSQKLFSPAHPAGFPNFNKRSYDTLLTLTAGASPVGLQMADFDNDSKNDLVVSNNGSGTISLYKNTSSPGIIAFAPKTDIVVEPFCYKIAIGDINSDGKPDIIAGNQSNTAGLSVFINNSSTGTINFLPRIIIPLSISSGDISTEDIDRDGKADIAFTGTSGLTVVRNTTIGSTVSFATPVTFTTANFAQQVFLKDLDGDNKPDAAVSCSAANSISVLRNTSTAGTISFAPKIDFTVGTLPMGIAGADLNNDGATDLVAANYGSSSISVLKNNSTTGVISFSAASTYTLLPLANTDHLIINDLNGDGKPDVAIADRYNKTITLFRNKSTGSTITLTPLELSLTTGSLSNPVFLCAGDLDNDGRPDLTASCNGTNKIAIYRNISSPEITSVSATNVQPGQSIDISGYNFRVNPVENFVQFGAMKAQVTNASLTNLTVIVPPGSTNQQITVSTENLTGFTKKTINLVFSGGDTVIADSYAPRINAGLPLITSRHCLIGDYDLDGKNDIVTTNITQVAVYRNTTTAGTISFAPFIGLDAFSEVFNLVSGDVNADGKLDIIACQEGQFTLYINNSPGAGNISFIRTAHQIGSINRNGWISDYNKDGRPDLIADSDGYIVIVPNTSGLTDLTFGASILIPKTDYRERVSLNDFDGDGKMDILCGFSYLLNTSTEGAFTYGPLTSFATGTIKHWLLTDDFNADNKPDLAYLDSVLRKITLFKNTSTAGSISFTQVPEELFISGTFATRIISGELNGDGKTDIAVVNSSYEAASLFANNTIADNIQFRNKTDYAGGGIPYDIRAGDLDGDGKPDLVLANSYYNEYTLSILQYKKEPVIAQLPRIISFSPLSGPAGTTLTINGENFGTTPAGNIVHFGKVKAVVQAASATSLSVIVPYGAANEPFSVTNNFSLTAWTDRHFKITFPGAGTDFTAESFDPYQLFPSGNNPTSIIMSDMDLDGKNDLALTNADDKTLSIYRNISIPDSLGFQPGLIYPTGINPRSSAAGDLNADGKPELLVANKDGNSFYYYRNNSTAGNISFAQPDSLTTAGVPYSGVPSFPLSVKIADFDSDGKPDVAILNYNDSICFYRNISVAGGAILFDPVLKIHHRFTTGVKITVRDLDNDRKPDILLTSDNYSVHIFHNTSNIGRISFTASLVYSLSNPYWQYGNTLSTDLNEDGKPDLVSFQANEGLSFYKNLSYRGTHVLSPNQVTGPPDLYSGMVMDDLDGDGKTDFVLTKFITSCAAAVQKNKYSGNNEITVSNVPFNYPLYTASGGAFGIETGDLDNDGKPEIAVAIVATPANNISILRNRTGEYSGFCPGGNKTLTSTVTGITYQWQMNTGSGYSNLSDNTTISGSSTGTLQLSNIPAGWTNYKFRCKIDGSRYSQISQLQQTTAVTASVTINTTTTSICAGTLTTFNATATNGGTTPNYQWQLNGINTGTNTASYSSSTLANNDQVKVLMTSSIACANPVQASSNTITMSVTPAAQPAISISGTTTVTNGQTTPLSSQVSNQGGSPQYQWGDSTSTHGWQIITGATSATLTYNPLATGDKVRCALQSNAACATPNPVISNALEFTVTPVTAINPVPATRFGIRSYPNPVSTILYLDSLKISDHWTELELLSASGAAVRQPVVVSGRTSLTLNVSSLPSGAYLLRLKRRNGPEAIIRFVKQY